MPRPPKHSEEFRRDAVALVRSSPHRTIAEIGRELGVNHETLRSWVRRAERDETMAGGGLGSAELEELKRLRKQVKELELEKEILRKAAQYFAKEMTR
jgi:transposase